MRLGERAYTLEALNVHRQRVNGSQWQDDTRDGDNEDEAARGLVRSLASRSRWLLTRSRAGRQGGYNLQSLELAAFPDVAKKHNKWRWR